MTTITNIEAVSVFVVVDGRLCLAPIPAESARLLVGLLAPLQDGQPKATRLVAMPPSVAKHVEAAGKALVDAVQQRAAPSTGKLTKQHIADAQAEMRKWPPGEW